MGPNATLARRQFLTRTGAGLASLATLLGSEPPAAAAGPKPRAKRIIYLFMHGGPSQIELFDHKPALKKLHGQELPPSVRGNHRLTGMTSGQASLPVVAPNWGFARRGRSGTWVSDLLPHTAAIADDLCVVRSLCTEAINHDPAVTFLQTGHQEPGRPGFGAWVSYGLGSMTADLPAFVVLTSRGSAARPADPLHARLWGAGFLPSHHQGVQFRGGAEPVLFLRNPDGIDAAGRRKVLDAVAALNRRRLEATGDPEIAARIEQYETAFRMQAAVPELADLSKEEEKTFELYGPDARKPGTFAANCLLARRLAERGVRFVQLYHRGWDQHYEIPADLPLQCRDVDQPAAALVTDLKRRGLLEDTLVVWAGEFGRTVYCQGAYSPRSYGRDHHGGCFSGWLAGGGVKPGVAYGETDDYSFNVVKDRVHVHDLNATLLHCLGLDHTKLTFRFQGRDYRLTDVHGEVVRGLLS